MSGSTANLEIGGQKKRARGRRRVIPIHPALFAVFPLLALYAHNAGRIAFQQLEAPLAWAALGTVGVWIVLTALTRHVRKGALAASAAAVAFFSYGHVMNLLPAGPRELAAPLCIVALGLLMAAIIRTRWPLNDTTVVLNAVSIFLLVSPVWTISQTELSHSTAAVVKPSLPVQTVRLRRPAAPPAWAANLPDVYYIILDAYGRADRLKTFYGYDNTPFIRALEQRGFFVAEHSRSNYNQTPLCLASALNMTYLDDLATRVGADDGEAARQMLDNNPVATYLRGIGFHYVYLWSGVDEARSKGADVEYASDPAASSFQGQALGMTPLGMTAGAQKRLYDRHRAFFENEFRNLPQIARLPYHKFVFAHIAAPHPPFVFGPRGEPITPDRPFNLDDGSWLLRSITRDQYQAGYVGQLRYVNSRVLAAVDGILKNSRRPPIIILQGDHGSRMNLDWDSLANTDLREPFSILNAYRVPGGGKGYLYDRITPVNSFRILLTRFFRANLPPLPDRSFYSPASEPLEFSEVTDLIPRAQFASSR